MSNAADDGVLSAPHVVEYPYRRSLGPVLGRFFTAPRACHPSDVPFAYALIQLDGADTAMLGVVRASNESQLSTGMRVQVQWADERTGGIQDIAGFTPEGAT
jgi:uncharacterized OB-fold protein